ncbi:histidine--tRNA ligase [Mycoplasma procyoni]|uniref:histidine--tRNA ligase n=1 Tax=Mycoplasma procyoni TaxID=568784 RepID=UPI00197C85A1|nr:histidine--tRNA ligase [Mycoplasma procyoni]MBN3534963.1 histidine--tRNA ligase [Mycoplasma procyoni]
MYQKPKGTKDIYGIEANAYQKLRQVVFEKAKSWNFKYIETPIFETYELFSRTSGETSDIVNKEMYVFEDKANRKMALRPEGTAPAVRLILENKLYLSNDKYFYFGPMFRYERPQKGRYRQFYQAGFEFISEKNIYNDFEVISAADSILKELKIQDYVLKINTLGSKQERLKYIEYLRQYFSQYKDQLSEISQQRIDKNPLRILDDKIDSQKDFVQNVLPLSSFLETQTLEYFNQLQQLLNKYNIKFEVDSSLVRGLDYYDEIVFEFVSESPALGTKATVIGGGRYDNLFSEIGNQNLSSIGFGVGIERLLEIILYNNEINLEQKSDVFVGIINEQETQELQEIIFELRSLNFSVEYNKTPLKPQKLFKKVDQTQYNFLIFKEKDQKADYITIKDLQTKENTELHRSKIEAFLKGKHENN